MGNGDFSQDVGGEECNQDDQMNGEGQAQNGGYSENSGQQGPGRDDDR